MYQKADHALIRKRLEQGLSNKQIVERTGSHPATVSMLRREWKREKRIEKLKQEVFDSPIIQTQAD